MSSSQPFVLSLPVPLLLLLHLHILDYPLANNPEYDHNIFNPRVRGLRDRIKSMEDVCYFLVGKLEGKKSNVALLPTYPCLRPSDTISFRTSLTKYLETLRYRSLQTLSTDSAKGRNDVEKHAAWWWKDVVVRKSLLEECSGERFERLLLSLSTHALLKGVPGPILLHNIGTTLATLPKDYANLLTIAQSAKNNWKRSASLLIYRQNDLYTLRDRLAGKNEQTTSTFGVLSTERLLALSDSKFRDTLRDHWSGHEGHVALCFLKELGGLKASTVLSSTSSLSQNGSEHISRSRDADSQNSAVPSPLPIAAAYHPTNIRKLRAPVFSSRKMKFSSKPASSTALCAVEPGTMSSTTAQGLTTHATIILSDRLDAENKMHHALKDALAKARRVGQELDAHLTEARTGLHRVELDLNLSKQDEEGLGVDFKTHATPGLLVSLSLQTPASDETLESRINYIRGSVLPGYPSIPQPRLLISPPPPIVPARVTSKPLLQPSSKSTDFTRKASSNVLKSRTPTSILPVTIKPTHVPKSANTDEKSRRKSIRHSLAHIRRPSLYGGNRLLDEVYRIVDAVRDDDMQFQADDLDDVLTPKPKTRGTRLNIHTSQMKQRQPSIPILEPSHSLPSLMASSSSDFLYDTTASDEDQEVAEKNNVYYQEAPSMTLRDILLRAADTTQCDLLDDDDAQLEDESFGWD